MPNDEFHWLFKFFKELFRNLPKRLGKATEFFRDGVSLVLHSVQTHIPAKQSTVTACPRIGRNWNFAPHVCEFSPSPQKVRLCTLPSQQNPFWSWFIRRLPKELELCYTHSLKYIRRGNYVPCIPVWKVLINWESFLCLYIPCWSLCSRTWVVSPWIRIWSHWVTAN